MAKNGVWAGLIVAALAAAGCSGGGPKLASVNGTPITSEEFNEYLEIKPSVRVMIQDNSVDLPVSDTLAFQAMQDVVTQKIVLQLAKEKGLEVMPADIDAEIEFKKKLQANYIQAMKLRGLSPRQIRKSVELELAQERLITKGITVTDADVDDLIKSKPELFVEPAKASMELIYVEDEVQRSQSEMALAASGSSFGTVRSQFDKSPEKMRNQFDMTRNSGEGLPIKDLSASFQKAVEATPEGKTTGWIKVGKGYAKIKVHKKIASKKIDFTPERRSFLKRQMALDKGKKKDTLAKDVADKLRDSNIQILDPNLKDPWSRFEERLKSAAKSTT